MDMPLTQLFSTLSWMMGSKLWSAREVKKEFRWQMKLNFPQNLGSHKYGVLPSSLGLSGRKIQMDQLEADSDPDCMCLFS